MTGRRPWRELLVQLQAELDPEGEAGITFASAWVANLATPAVLVVPVRRFTARPDVRWELALQVVVGIQGDDDELLFELTERALALFGPGRLGIVTGDTVFGQDDRAGGTYLVATSTLTA